MTQEETPGRAPTNVASDFAEIAGEFTKRVSRIVWCTVATVDTKDRPRTRLLHPIWETDGRLVGHIATGRHSLKEKHIARNANVSLTYWDQVHEQVYVEATARWADDAAEKHRIWDLFKSTPPPYGYDPALIWQGGVESEDFGVLTLTPRRVELYGIADLMAGRPPTVWRAG
ncbi:MAG TPA: pyridoxamine 5'-phosphate oxidase family protein [Dehalococcoidia bacterium]